MKKPTIFCEVDEIKGLWGGLAARMARWAITAWRKVAKRLVPASSEFRISKPVD